MGRIAAFIYGLVCYVMFLGVFLYLIGWVGNVIVPRSIDSGTAGPVGQAMLINLAILAIFGIQHTVMARPSFKGWWTKFVSKPVERSTYVLLTNLLLILMFWLWQPMTGVIWDVQNPAGRAILWGLFACGWLLVLITTFLINHFDLFGLRQVWLHLQGREYTYLGFVTPAIYKYIRHPLYVGWQLAFWATPEMTSGHLLFAITTSVYMVIAIQFEERNLVEFHGEKYEAYRRRTGWFLPRPPNRQEASKTAAEP